MQEHWFTKNPFTSVQVVKKTHQLWQNMQMEADSEDLFRNVPFFE